MKKTILVVDYLSAYGHRSFNRIHIEALQSCGVNIILLSKKGYFSYLNDKTSIQYSIPSFLFKHFKPGKAAQLLVRLLDILKLLYTRYVAYKVKADYTIFLCYDILSFFTYRTKANVAIVNHYNVDDIGNDFKCRLTKRLPSHYVHVALNDFIKNRLEYLLPHANIIVIPHGIDHRIVDIDKMPLMKYNLQNYIFCPVSSSCDISFLQGILESDEVEEYLADNNIKVCIKGQSIKINNNNIISLPSYIDEELYNCLLTNAFAVLLPYSDSFKFRVSGVLHECFANNIPVICRRTECFVQYSEYICYDFMVEGSSGFIASLSSIKNSVEYYHKLDRLSPTNGWKNLIS